MTGEYVASREDRRMVHRVFRHWLGWKRLSRLPSINRIQPDALSAEWSKSFIICSESSRAGKRILYLDYIGAELRRGLTVGPDRTGSAHVRPGTRLYWATCCVDALFALRTPLIVEGGVPSAGKHILAFRLILLPFSDSAGELRYAYGAINGRDIELLDRYVSREGLTLHVYDDGQKAWLEPESLPDPPRPPAFQLR